MNTNYAQGYLITVIATTSLLLGCSHNSPAPVFDLTTQSSQIQSHQVKSDKPVGGDLNASQIPESYLVKPGDTLFSIAWYYSMAAEDIADINQLSNNLIYPGQKLLLVRQTPDAYFDSESLLLALNREVLRTPVSIGSAAKKQESTLIVKNRSNSNKINQNNKKHAIKKSQISNNQQVRSRLPTENSNLINWIWPTDGKVVGRFSTKSNANRGLDIAAKQGQPVRATAPGKVVYQGNGLRGYGNLVIIKHNNNYLSAYAHNNKIHVAENEIVKAGQRIADVGNSGTISDKLHFEIRYKGKPVDPLNYLPQKKF